METAAPLEVSPAAMLREAFLAVIRPEPSPGVVHPAAFPVVTPLEPFRPVIRPGASAVASLAVTEGAASQVAMVEEAEAVKDPT